MNRIVILLGILFSTVIFSCKDKEEATETSGTVTLSSELKQSGSQFVIEAFSFKDAALVDSDPETDADLFLVNEFAVNEVIGGRFNSNSNNFEAFAFVTSFPSLATAEEFFNAYKTIEENIFSSSTDVLQAGQVYICRTNGGNYAKFLIREVNVFQEDGFVTATIDWEYQPNGTKLFP